MTIQALHSNIILHVPDGLHGIILGNIHTDHWRFKHYVKENECIIAPMCEFYFRPFVDNSPNSVFRIQIPHFVANIYRVKNYLKVRHMSSLESRYVQEEDSVQIPEQDRSMYYTLDNQYINIITSTFCKFLISAEAINCCSDRTRVMLFSNLRLYFCGPHYNGIDYHKVIIIPLL